MLVSSSQNCVTPYLTYYMRFFTIFHLLLLHVHYMGSVQERCNMNLETSIMVRFSRANLS